MTHKCIIQESAMVEQNQQVYWYDKYLSAKGAIKYFMGWYPYWSPAGYYECKCCGFTWTENGEESHAKNCPVTKFKGTNDG
jgi:hypothetical protein